MKKGSYSFDKFRNQRYEAKLLEVRAARNLAELIPSLKYAGLNKNMKVLDVGSGTGTRTIELAKFVVDGSVVGIDSSHSLLKRAVGLSSRIKYKI